MTQSELNWSTNDKAHREQLRALLADGRRHTQAEMRRAGGDRYGARLLELRRRDRLDVRVTCIETGVFEYQLVGTLPDAPRQLTARQVAKLCAAWRAAA